MDRKEFLEKLGVGAAFALTATCLGGCSKDTASQSSEVDVTIDITDPAFADLNNVGYIVLQDSGIVVARSLQDASYIAATVRCSHEALDEIIYQNGIWLCQAHGAQFEEDGTGLNANGSRGLTIFNTELNGSNLRIFS